MIRRMIFALPLLLAACSHSSPPPAGQTQFVLPNAGNTAMEIQKALPPGTAMDSAQTYLQQRGYTCTPTMGNAYNLLECTRDEPLRPGVVRRWHVTIYSRSSRVDHVEIGNSVTSQVQAREASQPPTR